MKEGLERGNAEVDAEHQEGKKKLLDEGLEQLGRTSELDAETDDDLTD